MTVELKPLVNQVIDVVKDKTDGVRKNAAVLLARMASDETLGPVVRQNHGMEVLRSLRGRLK